MTRQVFYITVPAFGADAWVCSDRAYPYPEGLSTHVVD